MKRFLLVLTITVSVLACAAQKDSLPPYQRFPELPAFTLLLSDSTTKYTKADLPKNKPVLLFVFSPECSHCQQEAKEMVENKALLKNIHVVMATFYPFPQMNEFAEKYRLAEIPNLVIGKDIFFTLPGFYDIRNLPFHALYSKKGKLIKAMEGSAGLTEMVKLLEE